MAKLNSVKERLHKGYAQTMDVTKVLADERSQFQHIRIFDTVANGRVMTLDDIVQITSRDESAYADMLTHLPILEHGKVERVMIVGGGDLSIADEALKHKGVKEVVLVDIDGRVIELCKKLFGDINAKAFRDKRMTIEVADAFEYLGRKSSKNRFDLIIADRPDPVGPGKALFGETFYDRVKGALRKGGYATFQTGVPFYQPWEITEALNELADFFPRSGLYLTVVPTYIGGFMALSWASKGGKPLGTAAGIKKAAAAYKRAKLKMRLLQSRHPRRSLCAADLDPEAGALTFDPLPLRWAEAQLRVLPRQCATRMRGSGPSPRRGMAWHGHRAPHLADRGWYRRLGAGHGRRGRCVESGISGFRRHATDPDARRLSQRPVAGHRSGLLVADSHYRKAERGYFRS